jgi:predicted ATPase/DNA-binding CsgD family transcriptional regulator
MATAYLPTVSTNFIGRDHELAEIARLLAGDARLLTLVGPGGVGKTRLALEAARIMLNSPLQRNGNKLEDGVRFAPLQPLTSPDFMVAAISVAVNFQCYEGCEVKGQLLDYFRDKSMLLVLDNLEHLLDGVHLLSEILNAAPGVRILATSRERLNLLEEWVLDVGGLSFPASESETDLEHYNAVQLFLQHARRVNASFTLTGLNKPAIIRICRLVEGMPLAIELAAAWVRALSPEAIASEIGYSLDILETPARNVEPRHRNIRAVFEPTWDRLSDEERSVFRKLSVFRGGCTREAAESVAEASLRTLSSLLDKSLLRVNEKGRYDIHELLRQYGEEQLAASGGVAATRDAHSGYYADFFRQRQDDLKGRRQLEALDEIETDFDNIRAAWLWAVQRGHAEPIDRAVESLRLYCDMRSRFQEAEELFRQAEQVFASVDERVWARIAVRRIWILRLGDLEYDENIALACLDRCLAIARVHDDRSEIAFCLSSQGIQTFSTTEVSVSYFKESLAIYRELDEPYYVGDVISWIGVAEPDHALALELFQESLRIHRAIGAVNLVAWVLINTGLAHLFVGNLAEAETALQEALSLQRTRGDRKGQSWGLYWLGKAAFLAGDFEKSRALAEENYAFSRASNILYGNKGSLGLLAAIAAVVDEDYTRARSLAERELALPRSTSDGSPTFDALWSMAVAVWGAGEYETARYYQHQALKLGMEISRYVFVLSCLPVSALILEHNGNKQQAAQMLGLAYARMPYTAWLEKWPLLNRLRARLEAELGADVYAAACQRGAQLDLLTTVRDLLSESGEAASVPTANGLTERELEILGLTAQGLSNREIAEKLVFSVGTVKWYLNQIYGKLHVGSRTQAIARARELRLLS